MENFSVYIIYSTKLKRFYTGTTDDFAKKLTEHNTGFFPDTFSKNGIPWESHLIINNLSSKQAYNIERHIKSMKSSVYIINLKKYPEMVDQLVKQFN